MTTTHEFSRDFERRDGIALVTGGTGGIGSAIVAMLGDRGCEVVFTFRNNAARAKEIVEAQAARGHRLTAFHLDGSDEHEVAELYAEIERQHDGIHTIVYASGPVVPMTHLSKVSPAQFRAQLVDDAAAFFAIVNLGLPALRRSRGSIVAVTTAATRRFPVRDGLSSAPKAAVEATIRAICAEEGRFGIRANTVGPGMLTDGMAEHLMSSGQLDERALDVARGNIPLRTFGRATDIAEAVCFLASDRARFISGQYLDVDGGFGV